MIPYLLAVAGGYLIGNALKDDTYAKGGAIKKYADKIVMQVTVHDDELFDYELSEYLKEKINVYKKYVDFNIVAGDYYTYKSKLKFYNDSDIVFIIDSEWEGDKEMATIYMNDENYTFNSHPFDSMGGLDTSELAINFKKAIDEIGTYSAVIALEGHAIYSENANSKEKANRILTNIKENTTFTTQKGRVETGKVVKQ